MYLKKVENIYSETPGAANQYRERYLHGIEKIVEKKLNEAQEERDQYGKTILANQECARQDLKDILGWPLTQTPEPTLAVQEEVLMNSEKWIVSRIHFEVLPGLWFYGELLRHNTASRLPLIIAQHGGAGTPEVCSSFFDSHNYNDMAMRIFHKGVNVFAPQLLLWKKGEFGEDAYSVRMDIENELRRVGGSIAALEIYCIQRTIDYFERVSWCDGRIGMIGLSYGSFYTLYTAACDTRIRAALACSLFSTRRSCFCTDFSWKDAYRKFGDAEVGALVYPRPLRIEFGDKDPGKWVSGAQEEYERLKTYYCNRPDELSTKKFDGGHEFCPEDDGIIWVLKKMGIQTE